MYIQRFLNIMDGNLIFVKPFFPDMELLELENLFNQAKFLAESINGANRSLTRGSYTEIKSLGSNKVWLSRLPIFSNSVETPITVKMKDKFSGIWEDAEYLIDYELGEVTLKNSNVIRFRNYSNVRYFDKERKPSARITYYSGFNLNEEFENNSEVALALINLMQTLKKPQYSDGMKKFKLERHYEVEYFSRGDMGGGKLGDELANSLLPFTKYRPRDFSS
jgi:hypothetical protein